MMSKFPHAAVVDGKQHDRFVIINIQQDRSLITLFFLNHFIYRLLQNEKCMCKNRLLFFEVSSSKIKIFGLNFLLTYTLSIIVIIHCICALAYNKQSE